MTLDRDLENQIMQILKKTTVLIDVDRICRSLGPDTRPAVTEFLRKWDKSLIKGTTLDGKTGYKWK